ncbi:MAG: non-homologous end-joining DNA ligase [Methanomicrobiales archaeon]|nr:non-homologous end-joining DNA ligase [Methanomicrobiales archaeon]
MELILPMLAAGGEPFTRQGWLFEPKFDGTRCIAHLSSGRIFLQNRRMNDISARYPDLLSALRKAVKTDCVLDGEIIVFSDGRVDFRALQKREQQQRKLRIDILSQKFPAIYVVFDILFLEGKNLMNHPLRERKTILRTQVEENNQVVLIDYIEEKGEAYFRAARKRGLEGIMGKRIESSYQPGVRSKDWVKIKREVAFDLVVGGFTRGSGWRAPFFAALAVGAYRDSALVYVGRVGSGFSTEDIETIRNAFQPTEVCPFDPRPDLEEVTWVKPTYVIEVRAMEVTHHRNLRAPVYVRTRVDKLPEQCTYDQIEEEVKRKKRHEGIPESV